MRRQLKSLMRTYGLSAPEVAFFLGLKPQTVRAYKCGARRITPAQIAKVRRSVGAVL